MLMTGLTAAAGNHGQNHGGMLVCSSFKNQHEMLLLHAAMQK